MKEAATRAVLHENLHGLRQATMSLQRAIDLCAGLGAGPDFAPSELDAIEVLASRFARTTDFLVNKVLRTLDRFELAPEGTLLDVINRAEKRGLVASAAVLREMKELRNEIVHEYLPAGLVDLLSDLRKRAPELLEIAGRTAAYAGKLTG